MWEATTTGALPAGVAAGGWDPGVAERGAAVSAGGLAPRKICCSSVATSLAFPFWTL